MSTPSPTNHIAEEVVHELAGLAFDVLPVLFLALMMITGVFCKFLINRFWPALPHTAVVFIAGIIVGTVNESNVSSYGENSNVVVKSVRQWSRINPELFLLSLLPALVFSDSFSQPFQIFKRGLSQVLWLAFPGVLAGALLMAVLLLHTVPVFKDELYLAITVGSILAATDPVAVVALLESVGGSPRLNVHIAGESMFNDGTAIVMFTIFSELFFFDSELDIGNSISFGEGVLVFLRQSLGGPLIGFVFSMGYHIVLWMLNHDMESGDTVMQLIMGVAVAYLAYFVAELAECSAVLSVVTLGISLGASAHPLIIDAKLFKGTWEALTFIANTVIFTLGGVLWGAFLVADDREGHVVWNDVYYLLLIYVYVVVVRAVVILFSYPVLRRAGLGTTWRDCVFMVWGGLRGSVGIALAVTLDLSIQETGTTNVGLRQKGSLILFFVGGVSLLTLVINGLTAGPLLRRLGLTGSGEGRTALLKVVHNRIVTKTQQNFEALREENKIYSIVPPEALRRFMPEVCWDDQPNSACLGGGKGGENSAGGKAGGDPMGGGVNGEISGGRAADVNINSTAATIVDNTSSSSDIQNFGRGEKGVRHSRGLMLDPMLVSDERHIEDKLHRQPLSKMVSNRAFSQFKPRRSGVLKAATHSPAPAAIRRMWERVCKAADRIKGESEAKSQLKSHEMSPDGQAIPTPTEEEEEEAKRIRGSGGILAQSLHGCDRADQVLRDSPMAINILGAYRETFLSMLRQGYWKSIREGALRADSLAALALLQSIDLAIEDAKMLGEMTDWRWVQRLKNDVVFYSVDVLSSMLHVTAEGIATELAKMKANVSLCKSRYFGFGDINADGSRRQARRVIECTKQDTIKPRRGHATLRAQLHQLEELERISIAIEFVHGHKHAQNELARIHANLTEEESVLGPRATTAAGVSSVLMDDGMSDADSRFMSRAAAVAVIHESRVEVELARDVLENADPRLVEQALAFMVGGVLLNKQAEEIADAQEEGIIDDRAAQNFLSDVNWRLTRLHGARALENLTIRQHPVTSPLGANMPEVEFDRAEEDLVLKHRFCEAMEQDFEYKFPHTDFGHNRDRSSRLLNIDGIRKRARRKGKRDNEDDAGEIAADGGTVKRDFLVRSASDATPLSSVKRQLRVSFDGDADDQQDESNVANV